MGDKMSVSTVGTIIHGPQAQSMVADKDGLGLDAVIVGRMFQKNPGVVWTFAEELGVQINVANQIGWGFGGRAEGKKKQAEFVQREKEEREVQKTKEYKM